MSRPPKRVNSADDSPRGQAYITEALFAVILLSGVLFLSTTLGVQQPLLTAEDREKQAEIKSDLQTVLDQSKQDGTLKANLLNWEDDDERFNRSGAGDVYLYYLKNRFGDRIYELNRRQTVFTNVKITPARNGTKTGGTTLNRTRPDIKPFIQYNDVGYRMVTADTQVTLYGGDRLKSPPRVHRTAQTPSMSYSGKEKLSDADSYPIPPATSSVEDDEVYNVVNVRVIVWF